MNTQNQARAILAQYRTAPSQAAAALYLAAAMAITYPEAAALVAAIVGA